MTYLLLIAGLVLLLFILKKTNKKQPRVGDVVTTEGVVGDNLLIVENVSAEQVEKAIENIKKYGYSIDFEYKLKYGCLFVNHPNGYEFLQLCYIVNCIHYEFEKNKVRCWCTTNKIDWGGSSDIMLYVHPNDEEHDNVYIATKSGDFYKQEFHGDSLCIKEDVLKIPYENCTKQL